MKSLCISALALTVTLVALRAQAQPIANVPGTPLGSEWNPGGPVVTASEAVYFGTATDFLGGPAPGSNLHLATSGIPGDLVLLKEENGGNAVSNWLAVVRFFNPADPTGTLGLDATKDEAFLAADAGPNGFSGFSLLPNADFIPAVTPVNGAYIESYDEFGPNGGILPGQLMIMIVGVYPVPEPAGMGTLLALGFSITARRARRAGFCHSKSTRLR